MKKVISLAVMVVIVLFCYAQNSADYDFQKSNFLQVSHPTNVQPSNGTNSSCKTSTELRIEQSVDQFEIHMS